MHEKAPSTLHLSVAEPVDSAPRTTWVWMFPVPALSQPSFSTGILCSWLGGRVSSLSLWLQAWSCCLTERKVKFSLLWNRMLLLREPSSPSLTFILRRLLHQPLQPLTTIRLHSRSSSCFNPSIHPSITEKSRRIFHPLTCFSFVIPVPISSIKPYNSAQHIHRCKKTYLDQKP